VEFEKTERNTRERGKKKYYSLIATENKKRYKSVRKKIGTDEKKGGQKYYIPLPRM